VYAVVRVDFAQRGPRDRDAQLFHALALLSLQSRTDSTYERAGAVAERVLRAHPDHHGALHYVLNVCDDRRERTAARRHTKAALEKRELLK
jgi:hypothetical protein